MNELIRAVVAMSWPLLFVGRGSERVRSGTGLLIMIGLVLVSGLVLGSLVPADLLFLPSWTGLGSGMLSLVLWVLLGSLARVAGGVSLPGPPLLSAIAIGALVGEIGAAGMIAGISDKRAAARLALAAAGGAMVGRVGDPALLLLMDQVGWSLAPLGLLTAMVAVPGGSLPRIEGHTVVTAAAAVVATAAIFAGDFLPHVLAAGCLLMAGLAGGKLRVVDLRPVGWCFGLTVLVLLSTASGLPELAAWGLELVQEILGSWRMPGLTAIGVLIAVLSEGISGALLTSAVLDRALDLTVEGVPTALAAGLAVGGLAPLVIVGAVREGLLRWAVQVFLALLWAGLVL
ncbi:MAG: hypothetical protein P8R54_17805 [Myxococcota bacterium]|nr:hypothetical protein [Myxococcota bacterium]